MPDVPQAVLDLIRKFADNADHYRSASYNETQCRIDFVNPMFESLGWDMANIKGYAEGYRDVVHEDAIKAGGATKAPDYGFYIGGIRKFFLEAKKPAVNLKADPEPAYQLRRYAWSAKLALSVLTDFEEFAIYDARIKPSKDDKASAARIFYCTWEEYPEKWEQLASIFARESILKGSYDRYAATAKGKRGTAEVDAAFLKEIEDWREALARSFALRNPQLNQRDLNFAVQRTIDRVIFLRICEDRGIELYGQLQGLLNGESTYDRLNAIFRRADEKYNSGIFHFEVEKGRAEPPDKLTPSLRVDDKVLKDVIRALYYPDSPYEFSVLPADILGQVYEQFLGKVIRLTAGHRAVVEEKPEVRKAGGVFYTPTYIVDYIVRQTVGRLLGDDGASSGENVGDRAGADAMTPKQAAALRILDPACGSGSFLIGAYQYLLDWHLNWYVHHDPESWARGKSPAVHRVIRSESPIRNSADATKAGALNADHILDWRLTTAERKRILLNNIFGVDIDPQAVEVTMLSLLLKVLEGESGEVVNNQWRLLHERALPDLGHNIKCGNSLIGSDFYNGHQLSMFDEEERLRVNIFDWHQEFSAILGRPSRRIGAGKECGFHAVIGNPPYVRMESFKEAKSYLSMHYASHEERADLYAYFLERALGLLHSAGWLGFVVSNKFIRAKYGKPLRTVISEAANVRVIADFAGANVFEGATVRTIVLIAGKRQDLTMGPAHYVPVPSKETIAAFRLKRQTVSEYARQAAVPLAPNALSPDRWRLASAAESSLLDRLSASSVPLAEYLGARVLFGVKSGLNDAFVLDGSTAKRLVAGSKRAKRVIRPILFGKDIRRYQVRPAGRSLIYLHPELDVSDFPRIDAHLMRFKRALEDRAGTMNWFELQQPAVALLPILDRPHIIYPIIAKECRFALDTDAFLINDKAFVLPTADEGLLAILNSRLSNFYFARVCAALEGASGRYLEFRAQYVDRFPIPSAFRHAPVELRELGGQMVVLHKALAVAGTPHQKQALQRQIDSTDRRIDQLVYQLYGLTEDEIHIVEEDTD